MWVRSVEAVHRAFGLHPPSLRLTKFESLKAAPETELPRIVRGLGRDDLLDQVEKIAEDTRFANYPDSAKGAGKFLRAASPGLWRERFSPDERNRLEELMRPTLEKFGYDRRLPSIPCVSAWHPAGVRIRRRRRSDAADRARRPVRTNSTSRRAGPDSRERADERTRPA
jgi:hypothetical protein